MRNVYAVDATEMYHREVLYSAENQRRRVDRKERRRSVVHDARRHHEDDGHRGYRGRKVGERGL